MHVECIRFGECDCDHIPPGYELVYPTADAVLEVLRSPEMLGTGKARTFEKRCARGSTSHAPAGYKLTHGERSR